MNRADAVKQTRALLDSVGLPDWKIRLVTDLTRPFLGKCVYSDKCIYLNAHHIDTHPEIEIIDTIKHEVAHALTPNHNHDEVWQAKAKELGAIPTVCGGNMSLSPAAIDAIRSGSLVEVDFEESVIRTPKYKITRLTDKCPTCGKVAKEKSSFEVNGKKVIILECLHVITKVAESFSPFESIVFDDIKPYREHECVNGHKWSSEIQLNKNTQNISGELYWCPICEKKASYSSEIKQCKHQWNKTICALCNAKRLYPFQIEGARFLEKANGRAGLFDEMGLGKSVQSLAWLKYHPEALPVLFIVKSGIKYQWFKEIIRILGMEYLAQVIGTSNECLLPGLKCYIVSYDMLVFKTRTVRGKQINQGFDIKKFKERGIKTVILDECQQIKNPDSSRTQMVRQIIRDTPHVIPLSGTPWKNRGSELYPVLNMLDPIKFNSYQGFLNTWVDYYYDAGKQKMGGIANVPRFREYTKDIIIRRERAQVMPELPLIQRNANYCEMNEDAQKAYSNEVNDFVSFWNRMVIDGEEDSFSATQNILARLAKMRHITGLAKIPSTIEFVRDFMEETERKLVIFVHHKDVGELLHNTLSTLCMNESWPLPLKLTADLSSEERFDVQEKFNGPNHRLMIASTLASGEGLNLQTCSDCIMHERQWNPANEEQAEGRFIRIGQMASSVNANYMLAEGSVDTIFHNLVEKKRIQFHNAMNKGEIVKWNEGSLVKDLAQSIVDSARGK